MHFPTWVDLKGQDAVPETVHHVVICNLPVLQRFFLYPFKCHNTNFLLTLSILRQEKTVYENTFIK